MKLTGTGGVPCNQPTYNCPNLSSLGACGAPPSDTNEPCSPYHYGSVVVHDPGLEIATPSIIVNYICNGTSTSATLQGNYQFSEPTFFSAGRVEVEGVSSRFLSNLVIGTPGSGCQPTGFNGGVWHHNSETGALTILGTSTAHAIGVRSGTSNCPAHCHELAQVVTLEQQSIPASPGKHVDSFPKTPPGEAYSAAPASCWKPTAGEFEISERTFTIMMVGIASWLHPEPPTPGGSVEVGAVVTPSDVVWASAASEAPYAAEIFLWDPAVPDRARRWTLAREQIAGATVKASWDGLVRDQNGNGSNTFPLTASDYFLRVNLYFENKTQQQPHETVSFQYIEPRIVIVSPNGRVVPIPGYDYPQTYIGKWETATVVSSTQDFEVTPAWHGSGYTTFAPQQTTATGESVPCRFWIQDSVETLHVSAVVAGVPLQATRTVDVRDYWMQSENNTSPEAFPFTTTQGPNSSGFGIYAGNVSFSNGWRQNMLVLSNNPSNLYLHDNPVGRKLTPEWLNYDIGNLSGKSTGQHNYLKNCDGTDPDGLSGHPLIPGANANVVRHSWKGFSSPRLMDYPYYVCAFPERRRRSNGNCFGAVGHAFGATGLDSFLGGDGGMLQGISMAGLEKRDEFNTWEDIRSLEASELSVVVFTSNHAVLVLGGESFSSASIWAGNVNLPYSGLYAAFAQTTMTAYCGEGGSWINPETAISLYSLN